MKPGSLHLSDSSGPAPSPSVGQGNLLKREVFLRIISSIGRAGSFAQAASLVTYLRVCLSIILPSLARRERRLRGRPGFSRRLPYRRLVMISRQLSIYDNEGARKIDRKQRVQHKTPAAFSYKKDEKQNSNNWFIPKNWGLNLTKTVSRWHFDINGQIAPDTVRNISSKIDVFKR